MALCALVLTDTADGAMHGFAQLTADLSRGHCTDNLPPVHKTCRTAGKPVRLQVWESHMPLCESQSTDHSLKTTLSSQQHTAFIYCSSVLRVAQPNAGVTQSR